MVIIEVIQTFPDIKSVFSENFIGTKKCGVQCSSTQNKLRTQQVTP